MRLLESGAVGDSFEEAGEGGLAFFSEGGGDDHALRFNAAKFTRGEVGDDDHLASDEGFGSVGLGDSGDDLADFGADVHGEAQEFVGLFDFFGGEDGANTELDLEEIVDGDVGGRRAAAAGISAGAAALAVVASGRQACRCWSLTIASVVAAAASAALLRSSSICCILSIALLSARGKTASIRARRVPTFNCPQRKVLRLVCETSLRPSWVKIFAVESGMMGWASTVMMRRASAEV